MKKGVEFRDFNGKTVRTRKQSVVLQTIEVYRLWIEGQGIKWENKAISGALGIDVGWFADEFTFDIIKRFLFFRHAPHLAFPGSYDDQPAFWVDVCMGLDGLFGISL